MTPRALKKCTARTEPYFFSNGAMKYFGDTMQNFGVRTSVIREIDVWELYRKEPVKCGLQTSHYFRRDNYKQIY